MPGGTPEWTQRTRLDAGHVSAQGLPIQSRPSAQFLSCRSPALGQLRLCTPRARKTAADLRVIAGDDKTPLKFQHRKIRQRPMNWPCSGCRCRACRRAVDEEHRSIVYAGNAKAAAEPAPDATAASTPGTVIALHLPPRQGQTAAICRARLRAVKRPGHANGDRALQRAAGARGSSSGITWDPPVDYALKSGKPVVDAGN